MKIKSIKILSLVVVAVLLFTVPYFNVYAQENTTSNTQQTTDGKTDDEASTTSPDLPITEPSTEEPDVTENQINYIAFSKSEISIGLNEKVQLSVNDQNGKKVTTDITYSSSDKKVVTVDSTGNVTGKKLGSAIITANTSNGKTAACKVTVKDAPISVKLNITSASIGIGEKSVDLDSTVTGGYSKQRKYTSSNTKIATVDSNGYITGKKNGKTTVTVTTYNGLTATQNITVKDDSLSLNVNSTQLALDNKNVQKVKYGTSVQGRNLEAFIISDFSSDKTLNQECKIKVSGSVNVRSGPGTSYSIVSSLKNGTKVTRVEKAVKKANGYTWDKIILSNKKTGYVATNYLVLVKDKTPAKKTLFIDFAIHGFEDEYYRDGQVLVKEANALIAYFVNHTSQLKNYTLVIVPCANPDGTIAGTNNQSACKTAFGRCTAKHIDMNRDWGSFKSIETKKLKDFIVKTKPNFYLNMHGWLDETIGDSNLNTIINKALGLSKKINNYPTQDGYAIDWVHKNLKIPATLVEYKSSSSVSTDKDISMIKAIIDSNGRALSTSSSSAKKFPTPVNWKNGSTAESVYKVSNLTEKSDSLKAKTSAKCYRKAGSSYVIVYDYGSKKHKAGFVKYAGGVKKAPTKSKTYKNGSTSETVYADTSKKTKIGSLDAKESCICLGKIDGMYLVVYNVSGTNKQKCGFVKYNGGCS